MYPRMGSPHPIPQNMFSIFELVSTTVFGLKVLIENTRVGEFNVGMGHP